MDVVLELMQPFGKSAQIAKANKFLWLSLAAGDRLTGVRVPLQQAGLFVVAI